MKCYTLPENGSINVGECQQNSSIFFKPFFLLCKLLLPSASLLTLLGDKERLFPAVEKDL